VLLSYSHFVNSLAQLFERRDGRVQLSKCSGERIGDLDVGQTAEVEADRRDIDVSAKDTSNVLDDANGSVDRGIDTRDLALEAVAVEGTRRLISLCRRL